MAKKAKIPTKKSLKTKGKKMAKTPTPKDDDEPEVEEVEQEEETLPATPPPATPEQAPIAATDPYPTGSPPDDHDEKFFAAYGFHRGKETAEKPAEEDK